MFIHVQSPFLSPVERVLSHPSPEKGIKRHILFLSRYGEGRGGEQISLERDPSNHDRDKEGQLINLQLFSYLNRQGLNIAQGIGCLSPAT